MSFFSKSLGLSILIFLCASLCTAQTKSNQKQKSLEEELMRLTRAVEEAETKKDYAALDQLLTDGYIFTAPGGITSDKKQLIEDIKKDEGETGQTIDYDDSKVYDYGTTAVVNYLMTVKGKDKDGKDYTNRYRNTVTWIKQQNRWRMAAIHVSRVRP